MAKTYLFISDPGHGWLRVPLVELEAIKDKISQFSYIHGKYAYLEEDSDAGIFLEHKFGKDITNTELKALRAITEKHEENTAIRSYEPYHVRTEEEKNFMEKVISHLLQMRFKKSTKTKIRKASYEDCKWWKEYYHIIL